MPEFDHARERAFREKLTGVLDGAALALLTSLGHRSGLFDVMGGLPGPATSAEIADEAGLHERYVREWLGAMVAGGFVEHDPVTSTFRLPPEHAAALSRAARPRNLAATFQWIPMLGAAEDLVLECFEHGGGVPYSGYPRFHAVMAEESDQTVVAPLLDEVLPLVPGLRGALERGIDVLDVGCGSGRALVRLARAFPSSRFTGYDLSPEAIAAARALACELGLRNLRFEARDVSELGRTSDLDLVTAFDAIHDQAKPEAVLRGVAAALRPDGTFLMQDVAATSELHRDAERPLAAFFYAVSCLHCTSVSLAAGGAGLGAMWGREAALRMLADAGFGRTEVRRLPRDPAREWFVARK